MASGGTETPLRSRLVIPAALLVTAVYVKGRLDASARRQDVRPPAPVPPAIDPVLRAEAEAADALVIAEAQTAATAATVERPRVHDPHERSVLSEWASTPVWTPPRRRRTRDASDDAALAEWVASPAPRPVRRHDPADEGHRAVLAEWATHVAPPPSPAATPPESAVLEIVVDESGHFSLGGWAAQPGHMALCGVTFRDRRDRVVDAASIRLVAEAATNVTGEGLVVLSEPGFAPDVEGFTILLAAAAPGSFAAAGRYEVVAA